MRPKRAPNEIKRWFALGLLGGCMMNHPLSGASASNPSTSGEKRALRGVELAVEPGPTGAGGWTKRPAYPLAPGMAGPIVGVHRGVLIAAGGANFPDKKPWEGGIKAYYDDLFVLLPGETSWRAAGRLPNRLAYAAVVSTSEGVLAIGGENADSVRGEVLRLTWDGQTVRVEQRTPLPSSRTCAAAVVLEGKLYVAGGYGSGDVSARLSTSDFWCLDLADEKATWRTLPSWPGPTRALAVTAALEGAVYLLSGLNMSADADGKPQPTYLTDAYRYLSGAWEKLPQMPWSAVAAPSPAPVTRNPARILVLGGVDGRLVGKVPRDTRVPGDILSFDAATRSWRLWSEPWPDPVVTATPVRVGDAWWFVSGETMAGVRTTSVWSWNPEARQ